MLTIETLRAYGANVNEGLARCLNNEAFYLRLVRMGAMDKNFDRLNEALDAGDRQAAFEAAHALKGAIGNLALTPILEPVSALTELLRHENDGDPTPYRDQINAQKAALNALIDG